MTSPRLTLRVDWRYCVALYCVVMLWASLHELIHHLVGYLVCGAWGYKTFNYFETACEASPVTYIATLAGPLLSFTAMWVGWWLLARARSSELNRQLGFAMIFAQLPAQRMTGPLFGGNDEYFAARHLFSAGTTTAAVTFVLILLLTVPPLVGAWRAIGNRRRPGWFLFYFLLFPYLLWGPAFIGLEYLLIERHLLDGRTIGIAHLFLLNEVVTIAGYFSVKKWLSREEGAERRPRWPAIGGTPTAPAP